MTILGELQKRGFEVRQCPGRLEIVTNMELRRRAAVEKTTVWQQVDAALAEILGVAQAGRDGDDA